MGYTETCQTPLAVAGRVLAYTYQDRSNYHAGMAVCSAPNGTADIMTREEIKEYELLAKFLSMKNGELARLK